MSDQATSLFTESSQSTTATQGSSTAQPSQDLAELTTLLAQVKNENGEPKYKSVKDALIGLQHAQTHIQTLTSEKRTVDEELKTLRPAASEVAELKSLVLKLTESSQPANTQAQGMTEEAVAKLVEQTMTANQRIAVAKANQAKVVEAVKKVHGDKAEEVFYAKAAELGMSIDDVNALSARTPAAVLKLLGVATDGGGGNASMASGINTTDFKPTQDSLIGRNKVVLPVGATNQELQAEAQRSRAMVAELESAGMSVDDLVKPSNYFKYFNK